MRKQQPIHASAEVRWYKEKNTGSIKTLLDSGAFAANARFKYSKETDIFSVILYFRSNSVWDQDHVTLADLHFFSPEIVMLDLHIGSELFITEGPKIIGEARITSI